MNLSCLFYFIYEVRIGIYGSRERCVCADRGGDRRIENCGLMLVYVNENSEIV